MSNKLKELLKATMCNVAAIKVAAAESGADSIGDADEATAAVNRAIIDNLELPKVERSAAQVELAKACAEAQEVAKYHMDPLAPITNRNRAGANGTTIEAARWRLEKAAKAAGVSLDLEGTMLCPEGKRYAYTKAKATPKAWHDAKWALDAATQAIAMRKLKAS